MGFLDSKIMTIGERQVLNMPDSITFGVLTKDNKIVLAKQKRAGNNGLNTINLFGGYIEDGESIEESLYREAYEECNIKEPDIRNLTPIYENKFVSVGYTTERNSLYIIHLNKTSDEINLVCNDKEEDIELLFINSDFYSILYARRNNECLKLDYFLLYLLWKVYSDSDAKR